MTSLRSLTNSSGQSPDGDSDLSTWAGAYVKIIGSVNGVRVTVEGEVTKAQKTILLLDRGKGKNQMLFELREIIQMEEIDRPVPVTKIQVRSLATVDETTVRQHLADRHGLQLEGINPLAKIALIDHAAAHKGKNLGHTHDPSRGPGQPTAAQIAERAAALNAASEQQEECDSCGRKVDGDRYKFLEIVYGESKGLLHCPACADPDEYEYA